LTEFPATGFPPNFAKLRVENYQLLDFKPSLNTAGYVNCTLEEEELEIASLGNNPKTSYIYLHVNNNLYDYTKS